MIDLPSGKRVRTIPDLAERQGVYYDAATNRLYAGCGLDGVTNIYDGTTFQLLGTVKFPDDTDNIRYDARSKRVIVGYAGAKELRKQETGTGGPWIYRRRREEDPRHCHRRPSRIVSP